MQPAEMILDGAVVPARYTLLREVDPAADGLVCNGTCAVPLATWLAHTAAGRDMTAVGVVVEGSDDIAGLKDHVGQIPFVALHLPKFSDGRIYTHARRLRSHWGYAGTILAFGDVLRDQLLYLSRVGVNAFYMADGSDLHASLSAFSLYSYFYQYESPSTAPANGHGRSAA